jgi:5-methylcytosine-specific restriction enzyme A
MDILFRVEARRAEKQRKRARRAGLRADLACHQWLYLLAAWRGHCAYCGQPYETIDHIIPLANGGGTTKTNVLPCCARCNEAKGTAVWLPAKAGEGRSVKW